MDNPLDNIPGVGALEDAVNTIGNMLSDIDTIYKEVEIYKPQDIVVSIFKEFDRALSFINGLIKPGWEVLSEFAGGTLYHEMLTLGLGLDYEKMEKEAQQGIKTVDTMLSFALLYPKAILGLDSILRFFLGQRAPNISESAIGKISEEMGLSWALGMQIDKAFETAVGTSIEEAILDQKRPTGLEWPVVRQLFRQYLLTDEQATDALGKLGFKEELITLIKKMDTNQLPVGDLQALYQYGLINREDMRKYLRTQGFSEGDINHISKLYVDKMQTASGAQYRSLARQLLEREQITQQHYEDILKATNVPPVELADDLASIALEKSIIKSRLSISTIRARRLHNLVGDREAIQELVATGMPQNDAIATLESWTAGAIQHPMSAAKVMTYYRSGVLTDKSNVVSRLMAAGLTSKDAQFIVDHPDATGGTIHRMTAGLINSAYEDGALKVDDLIPLYKKAGYDDEAAGYLKQVAIFKDARRIWKAGEDEPLNKAEIIDAAFYGIISETDAIQKLVSLGYSSDNALILLEIKGKGPFQSGGTPVFATWQDALDFLASLGYDLIPPPDPRIAIATQMVEQQGYQVIAPLEPTTGQSGHIGSGGSTPGGTPMGGITQVPLPSTSEGRHSISPHSMTISPKLEDAALYTPSLSGSESDVENTMTDTYVTLPGGERVHLQYPANIVTNADGTANILIRAIP